MKTKTVVAAAVTLYAACITKVKKSMIHNELATNQYYNALSIVCFCLRLSLHPSFYRYIL